MITNGNFENGFTGWTVYDEPGSNSEVLLKNNTLIVDGQPGPGVDGYAARLYVYMCANARISQDILIDKNYILFDYVTYTIDNPENIGIRIRQGITILHSEGIPIGGYYNSAKAHAIDVSAYLNQTVTLEFYIEASARCYYGDHGNNWLWIDNVILADNPTQGILNISVPPDILSNWWTPGDIYINGILQGTGSVSTLVDAGQYNVSFGNVRLYTTPLPQTVTINAGQTIYVTALYSLSKGILDISTIPVPGDIYVDGNLVGNGSVSIDISGGPHTISYGTISMYTTPPNTVVDVILGEQVGTIGTYTVPCMQISLDTDTLTSLIEQSITLTAKVEPPAIYDVNFKVNGNVINPVPIPTDSSGIAILPLDTTGQLPGLYDLTAEAIGPATSCTSSSLTAALTTTTCTGIIIDNSSPITAYIGDIVTISVTSTTIEQSVVEFIETGLGMRIGSCITPPTGGSCTANIDTTGAPPGIYSIIAQIGNGPAQQCISGPIEAILQERPGKIIVMSIPPGARIYYDDVDIGINSSAIISNVTPNVPHNVRLVLPDYQEYIEQNITIIPGEVRILYIILTPITPPVEFGNLNVTSTPVDGVEFGLYTGEMDVTPVTLYDIPAGINAYESGLTGYNGVMGSVIIRAGETTNLNIPLQLSDPNMGIVLIESIPMEANIYIDGLPIGAHTSFATLMSPGLHTYELRLFGYKSVIGEFTVVTGYNDPAIISVILETIDICKWIASKGGWNNLRIFDIMTLVSTYLGQSNLGFTIAIAHIMGTVAYYLNNVSSGDSLTGCSPT